MGLKKHIERVYRANPFREPEGTKTAASIGALQKERKQLTHLFRDDGSIVEETTEMATDLKVHWEKIWSRPGSSHSLSDRCLFVSLL